MSYTIDDIVSVRWNEEYKRNVTITFKDGYEYSQLPDEGRYTELVKEWEEQGKSIIDYDRNYGKSLKDIISDKKIELKVKRNELANGTLDITTSLGNTFTVDLNKDNRSTLHQAYDNAANAGIPETDTTYWKMGDNQFYPISYAEIKELGIQMAVYIGDQFQHEAIKLTELQACTTIECVNGVTW